ncbi:MAG: N-acetylglucosaminyldiphosphoundecaprenol [Candidatus Berkelbacteria bacterium Athens1014_28]|uniref:N-acetylglucosaminyldiphosphoundecaprenol n=1 Tax=Candidatus Berkelbacteria bacterium Athens1014_28 TaxID=2017145 RepID=A0A554LPK9_9BACT|nr:MAG: N-acetylglucosaminyldiphosphoundecaprenol [Candidatus Berkelbacteria bacterium Athens1014_28]
MKLNRKKVNIINFPIDCFSKIEVLRYLFTRLNLKASTFITTVNSEFAYFAFTDNKVAEMLKKRSLNLADGAGILWAAKFLSLNLPKNKFWQVIVGVSKFKLSLLSIIFYPKYIKNPIPERITGSDFVWDLSKFARDNNLSIFLLGAGPTVAEQASLKLQTEVLGLKIAGTYGGTPKIKDEKNIIDLIKKTKADILLVAYDVPNEELWLERNLGKTEAKIGIGVGGTFDFLADRRKRAPRFLQIIGLEWLFRLIIEPSRFKRQFALPKFVWKVFKYKIQSL